MSILIIFCVLAVVRSNDDLNVGTTLFTKADLHKECWSTERVALLTTRMILEDLIPNKNILVINDNDFITDLIDYFRAILEIIRNDTKGKSKHITLSAFTDLLGGYLYHAVLPIAKHSYYGGLVDYNSIANLLAVYEEAKWFLRTNGQGWTKPLTTTVESCQIEPLPLNKDGGTCDNLIVLDDEDNGIPITADTPICDVTIPTPFFDSNTRPTAVALPYKINPLYSLQANTSNSLLMDFFVEAWNCLQVQRDKNDASEKFVLEMCHWLDDEAVPRLADDRFYPAFGSILRVQTTIRKMGLPSEAKIAEELRGPAPTSAIPDQGMSTNSMILMAVLITIFIWFILGAMFIVYKMRASHQEKKCEDSLNSSDYFFPESPNPDPSQTPQAKKKDPKVIKCPNKSRKKSHNITISTCKCHDSEDSAVLDSSTTEKKLPSITETSEYSTDSKGRRGHKDDTTTETEETTEGE